MSGHRYAVSRNIFFAALILLFSAFLSGCSSTPSWPLENIGTAQFSGSLARSGNILILPALTTRSNCQRSPLACQAFATHLAYSINTSSTTKAFLPQNHETMSVVHDNGMMVQNEINRVSATHLLVWDVGIVDDRAPFSFGPDAFSISTLKIIAIDTDETVIQLIKPYGLINPNLEDFIVLAGETGTRLGGYLAPLFNQALTL